jgi:hypothetical protein
VTAWLARRSDVARLELEASVWLEFGEIGAAGVVWDEAISNRTADRDTDGLEDGEQGEHEPPVLRDELEADRRIDGDITSDAEPVECGDNEEGTVCAAAAETEPERRAYEASEVESPLTACVKVLDQLIPIECNNGHAARVPTDDVHEKAPYEGTSS